MARPSTHTGITILALLLACALPPAASGAKPDAGEMMAAKQWAKNNLLTRRPPFFFLYDSLPSTGLCAEWELSEKTRDLDAQRREDTRIWTDPVTGLQIRCVGVEYADFPVVEWTVYLKNTGAKKTPIIKDLQGLDADFESEDEGEFILHGNRGDSCVAESYQPFTVPLRRDGIERFSPPFTAADVSGKSCDGPRGWPYFNLQEPGGGIILAVGWPGQWAASFMQNGNRGLRLVAGQQRTYFSLKPGEEIRTPLIALLFWRGTDVVRAQNLWRSWFLTHNLPRTEGQPQAPVTSIQAEGSLETMPRIEAFLDAGIKPDICWRDAGGERTWYPSRAGPYTGKMTWLNTGTWEPDPEKYPQGFKPFSDKVHSLGMQFLLWFEPERVGDPHSWLGAHHPEWLLPGCSAGSLLNEGNAEARKWLTDHVDGMITSQGLDWYREDMNGGKYGTAWAKNDAEDRQGMTENFYVQGHLAYWDELRRRHPSLRIDSCASGGRRNDLETLRRAVPLLRSDFQHPDMKGVIDGNQGHTYGLSSWIPWYGSGVYFTDSYAVRSFFMPGFDVIPPGNWAQSEKIRTEVKKAYEECSRIAPQMLGDYYPLTPYTLQPDQWIAWQFSRPDLGESMVQAFRHAEAPEETLTVQLHDLEPGTRYEVENFDGGHDVRTGRELMADFTITLKTKPAAAVFKLRAAR